MSQPHLAQFGVGAAPEERGTHHTHDLAQELLLTSQAAFDFPHQLFGEAQVLRACSRAWAACCAWRRSRARRSCACRRRRWLAFACFLAYRCVGDMMRSFVLWRSVAVAVCPCTCPLALVRTRSLCVTCCQDFRLSFVDDVRYTYVRTAVPIPTPSAARRIGLGGGR